MYRSLGPLSTLIAEFPWPVDFFSPDDLPAFLDTIDVQDYQFQENPAGFFSQFWLAFPGELAVALPGLDGVKLVVGSTTPDFTFITASLTVSTESILTLENILLALRFDPSILKPAALNPGDPVPEFVEIQVAGSVSINSSFDVEVQGFDAFKLTPAMIGDTGIIIAADDVKLDLSRTTNIPEVTAAGFDSSFMGVFIGQAQVKLPDGLPTLAPEDLFLKNCAIGTGGVSGRLEAHYSPVYDSIHKTFTGNGASTFSGIPFGLKDAILDIKQNAFQESTLSGTILLPFFDEPVDVTLSINQDGTLSAKLTAPGGLYTLTKPGILSMQLQSIGFVVAQGTLITKLSGQITPLFGASDTPPLNWPAFQVKELSIDSKGHVHIQGGWLNLPSQYHLNFYGFTIEITKLGFGNTPDGGKWIGFSGGIKLVGNMPAGASVDGLRLTWYDDGRTQITLNGVSVTFSVPDVLSFKGAVSYQSDTQEFHGSITLNLIALNMEVDGTAVFGSAPGYTYLALYLATQLPAGIPLWATGLGLYGIQGLLALDMQPNRQPNQPWYAINSNTDWYHGPPPDHSLPTVGVTNLSKWTNQAGSTAFGAGATIGTLSDNGHAFSGNVLLVILLPGPTILIQGSASLLQSRATLDKDANFRVLAVLDAHAGTLSVGLDARYQYDGSGRLINIHGGAEAFFNLNDASAWYLDLGEQDRQKRIQARIFQLFEADCYVMLDAHHLAMGAWIGYNNHWTFGPLSVTLQAWLDSNAVVNWHPVHFHGDLTLHGSVGLSAFGISLGLTVDASLTADVFDPFHIKGQFSVSLSLPWPLSNLSASVTLEWGPNPTVPALPAPLLEVAIEHFKTTTSWPLPILPDTAAPPMPVVPLDSRPHVTFSRPVNDDALVGVNAQPLVPPFERIGDPSQNKGPLTVRYGLKQVALQKQKSDGSWPETLAQTPPAPGVPKLYGSWAPVPLTPSGGGPNPGQTKLWLWSKSAFDYTRHTGGEWNQWFTDRFSGYPCGPLVQNCWDFEQVAPTSGLPNPWHHPAQPNLVFSNGSNGSMSIVSLNQPVEGLTHALRFTPVNVTINLPEPRNVVKIPALDSYPSYALFYGYDAQGNAFGPFTKSSSEQTTIGIRGGNMTRIGINTPITLAGPVGAAIGCAYVPSRNQLLFVEFGSGNLSAIDLSTSRYTVLGTGYMTPEDIVVTADGTKAYVTERPGNLLRLDLTKQQLDRAQATVVSSGMTAPQQIALDEANNTAYVVEYANPGNLLRIDLGNGYAAPMYGSLNYAVGLLLVPNSSTVYIGEQGGNGQLSRVTFTPGTDTTHDVLFSGLTSPFFMRWADGSHTRILLAQRDPANNIVQIDLTQASLSTTNLLGNLPFRPSSFALLPGNRLTVCCDQVVSGYDLQLCIPQICVVTADELIQHFEDELDHWSQQGYVFDPYTTYRLQVTTTVDAHGEGELSWYHPPTQKYIDYAYFRTGGPPVLQALSTPVGYPDAAPPFKSGLDDLGRYVSQAAAIPDAGTPGAYALGIEFNENYVDLLYALAQRDLVIHLYDNNGHARDGNGHLITLGNEWGRVDQLTLTESETSWLAVLSQNGCALVDPMIILHHRKLLSSTGSQVLTPQTLYEARLVPMLLHEDFSKDLTGWQASDLGPVGHSSNWTVRNHGILTGKAATAAGTALTLDGSPNLAVLALDFDFIVLANDSARPSQRYRILQYDNTAKTLTLDGTPNLTGGSSPWTIPASGAVEQTSDAETMLLRVDSGSTDYRVSVYMRSATANAIGLVFRYQNSGQYYRFSMDGQNKYRGLVKVSGGNMTTLAEDHVAYNQNQDYLITVEAIGSDLRVYQDGALVFSPVTDSTITSGQIGLYCSGNTSARFTDVRVEDYRATAPVAYRFTFTTPDTLP